MLLDNKQIIGLVVETKSGQKIGRIDGVIIEVETQSVYQYQVNSSGLGKLFSRNLLIHRDQVISIDDTKMVVEDLTGKTLAMESSLSGG